MLDQVWYAPDVSTPLRSAYEAAPSHVAVQAAEPLTISLRTVYASKDFDRLRLLGRGNDLLVLSETAMGTRPQVQRIHAYEEDIPARVPYKGFLSRTIYVSDAYSGKEPLWVRFHVIDVDRDPEGHKEVLDALGGLAKTAGAAFPAALPLMALAETLRASCDKLLQEIQKDDTVLEAKLTLEPPGGAKDGIPLREGHYVLFEKGIDGTAFTLEPNLVVKALHDGVAPGSYVVFTVDRSSHPSPEFVVSQRVATLLTQIKGKGTGARSSLDFLNETLQGYSNFRDLERLRELAEKAARGPLTPAEEALRKRLESRPALKPLLP